MVQDRIAALYGRYEEFDDLQEFVAQWAFSDDCELALWARSLGEITTGEGRIIFNELIKEAHDLARVSHYHIGFMVSMTVRLEWTNYVCMNSGEAAKMWLEDPTLSDEQDALLEASFRHPVTGAPLYCKAIDSGRLTRKKDPNNPVLCNLNSNIVQGILGGALDSYLAAGGDANGNYS